ncbi:MAG: DNA polymerase ligase N-terminal domain-containing protein [Planctomycetota bacterium]|nr:DNA polymerase ligase N-terminal domain-containing protein [Planctomycetota bacterium]
MAKPFVIQIHSGFGPLHYDFMLACGKALATWHLSRSPAEIGVSEPIAARKLADHRLEYLAYEGPVSRGRGEVKIFDKGTYELASMEENSWRVCLRGRLLQGRCELSQLPAGGDKWTFVWLEKA